MQKQEHKTHERKKMTNKEGAVKANKRKQQKKNIRGKKKENKNRAFLRRKKSKDIITT